MKRFLFAILLTLAFFSQKASGQKKKYRQISYIEITDTVLIKYINKVIDEQVNNKDSVNVFNKGFGYVGLIVQEYPMNKRDTIIHYSIAASSSHIPDNASELAYPDYYSFINKRLVLINIAVLRQFGAISYSEKSKKLIKKLVNKCLPKYDYPYYFYIGKSVYILKDKPPIVRIDQ